MKQQIKALITAVEFKALHTQKKYISEIHFLVLLE